jgi:uncharacterized membrane protein
MAEAEAFDEFAISVAREAWLTFRRDPGLFVIVGAVAIVVSFFSLGILIGPMQVGFIEVVRKVRAGEPVALSTLFGRMDALVPSLVVTTLGGLAFWLGLMLLVLPGLAVALFLSLSFPVIAFERRSGIDAMRRSFALVRANTLPTLALMILIALAHAVGTLIMLGALLTMPLATIAITLGYERLAARTPETAGYAPG